MQIFNFSKHLSLKRLSFLQCVFVISLSKVRRLHLCVFVSGSFIQLFWFAWIFCAGTMWFCYYNSVVYLKSSMAIFPALFFLGSFDNSEAFAFSIWVLLFFSNYMKKDIGILMGILLNLYIFWLYSYFYTVLIVLSHEYGRFFNLPVSY